MPPIDVCNAWGLDSVPTLTDYTGLQHGSNAGQRPPPVEKSSDWHLSAYADLAYLLDLIFRRTICGAAAPPVSESTNSPPTWAFSISRKNDDRFALNLWLPAGRAESRGLRYPPAHTADDRVLSRPRRKWLEPTSGLFNSLSGYESFYAKDNANYTRSWIADNTP
jgi:hypothetical protein